MRKRRAFANKALAVLLGGCLLQFGLGGCNPMTALIALAAAPVVTSTFGALIPGGSTTTTTTTAGRTEP